MQCGWTPRSGYQAGQALAADPEVTAVLCGNDDLALGLMRAMHAAGRAIPGDVSVVGFDDTPVAGFLTPPLTTVRLDFAELGRACFALLLALIEPKDAPAPRTTARARTDHQGERGAATICRAGPARPARQALDARPIGKEHLVIEKIHAAPQAFTPPARRPGAEEPG